MVKKVRSKLKGFSSISEEDQKRLDKIVGNYKKNMLESIRNKEVIENTKYEE